MFFGIGPEQGKKVKDEDAFMYAMERCTTDYAEEFLNEFIFYSIRKPSELQVFREDVVEWFYSGNWIFKESEEVLHGK